ncbi:hypothetical protein [Pseudomonas yamanorum]|uniref:hypothetical protein n=1 Tax=Pseudomonas yamanorum TaxID=515393 RepID=UPI003B9EAB38
MESAIELSFEVTEQERQAILQPLREYNISQCGENPFETFGLLLRDPATQPLRYKCPLTLQTPTNFIGLQQQFFLLDTSLPKQQRCRH